MGSQAHFNALCAELTSLACSISLQMFLCEQILDAGARQHYKAIDVNLGTVCDFCFESGKKPKRQNNHAHSKVLTAGPTLAIQVEGLSQLVMSVAHNVAQTSFSPTRTVEQSLRCLAVLSKVLSRQRRYMAQISVPQPTAIRINYDMSDVCRDCGHPYESIATGEELVDAYADDQKTTV